MQKGKPVAEIGDHVLVPDLVEQGCGCGHVAGVVPRSDIIQAPESAGKTVTGSLTARGLSGSLPGMSNQFYKR
jgi:hypothetical protein